MAFGHRRAALPQDLPQEWKQCRRRTPGPTNILRTFDTPDPAAQGADFRVAFSVCRGYAPSPNQPRTRSGSHRVDGSESFFWPKKCESGSNLTQGRRDRAPSSSQSVLVSVIDCVPFLGWRSSLPSEGRCRTSPRTQDAPASAILAPRPPRRRRTALARPRLYATDSAGASPGREAGGSCPGPVARR